MLRVLAAHPGPRPSVAVCAAMALMPPFAARRSLDLLVDEHLADRDDGDRYRIHDLVRLFGRERVADKGEGELLLRRAAGWYVHAANIAGRPLRRLSPDLSLDEPAPPGDTLPRFEDACAWLDDELANLLAVVRETGRRGWHGLVWRLVHAPSPLLGMRMTAGSWLSLAATARQAADAEQHLEAEAFFTSAMGIACAYAGDLAGSEKLLRETLRLRKRLGDHDMITASTMNLAALAGDMGKVDYALRRLAEVVRLEQARGSTQWLGPALNAICSNLLRLERYAECRDRSQLCLELAEKRGDVQSAAYARSNLSEALAALGFPSQAILEYRKAVELAQQCGDQLLEATAARRLGELSAAAGQAAQARRHWEHALRLLTALDSAEARGVRAQLDGLAALSPATSGRGSAVGSARRRPA
jgi:tetratricopeptide (TPR) repeat protein